MQVADTGLTLHSTHGAQIKQELTCSRRQSQRLRSHSTGVDVQVAGKGLTQRGVANDVVHVACDQALGFTIFLRIEVCGVGDTPIEHPLACSFVDLRPGSECRARSSGRLPTYTVRNCRDI